MTEQFIEISRFTYFYENIENKAIQCDKDCPPLDKLYEIYDNLVSENTETLLPFSKNFQDLWKEEIKSQSSIQTTNSSNNNDHYIIAHTFKKVENKVIIFETKIKRPFSKYNEAIEYIKKDNSKTLTAIIKEKIPSWKGDYSQDGDHFYFINLPISNFYSDLCNSQEIDLKIVDDVKNALTINGKCIFTLLGFNDKSFPENSFYNKDISHTITNEQQPLIVISPVKDKNKLIIFDDKLFVRCYYNKANDDDIKKSLPIRLVITTVLFQKAFLEYASKASINIANKRIKSENYSELQNLFSNFINHFWRLDMSNSLYLNKSYRIISKIWLLNQKFEIVKQHLTRNADIEEQSKQKLFSVLLAIIGLLTIVSAIHDGYDFYGNEKIEIWTKLIISFLPFVVLFSIWKFIKKIF